MSNKQHNGGKNLAAKSTKSVQNNPPQQRPVDVRVGSRRRTLRSSKAHDMTTMDPYEHCVLAATHMTGGSQGFPDGDLTPSLTLDYKQVITFNPTAGVIDFLLAPSAQSCINLISGTTSGIAVTGYNFDDANSMAFVSYTPASGTPGVISMSTMASPLNGLGATPITDTASSVFRPIVLVADVAYTGSSMMDGGSVQIQRVPNSEQMVGSMQIGTPKFGADTAMFNMISSNNYQPDSQSLMAKQSFSTRIVAHEPKYEPVRTSAVYNGAAAALNSRAYCYPTSASATAPGLAPSYHPSCEWTRVTYTGLDASASITVTLRYCVQFGINTNSSTYAPLARPSPAARPGIVTRVTNFVRSQPVATSFGRSLWDGIKRLGRAVLPTILPGVGGVIAGLL